MPEIGKPSASSCWKQEFKQMIPAARAVAALLALLAFLATASGATLSPSPSPSTYGRCQGNNLPYQINTRPQFVRALPSAVTSPVELRLCVGGAVTSVNVGITALTLDVSSDGVTYTNVVSLSPSSSGCPSPWVYDSTASACVAPYSPACHSVFYTPASSYNYVRGSAAGLQYGSACAFGPSGRPNTLEDNFVDGLIITITPTLSRQHLWTYAVGVSDNSAYSSDVGCGCPCTTNSVATPAFVGSTDTLTATYYCDTGNHAASPPGSVWLSGQALWGTTGALAVSAGGYTQCVAMQGTYLCASTSLSPTISVSPSATSSISVSSTDTLTPSRTVTDTASASDTVTATASATTSPSRTHSATVSSTVTSLSSPSPSRTVTRTQTVSGTTSRTPSVSGSRSSTSSTSESASQTDSVSITPSATDTVTVTASYTPTVSPTPSVTPTLTPTRSVSPSLTGSRSYTSSVTPTVTVTKTLTSTATPRPSPSSSPSPSVTPTNTATYSASPSFTPTWSPTYSATPSVTPSNTITRTTSLSISGTVTGTLSATASPTPSASLICQGAPVAYAANTRPTFVKLLGAALSNVNLELRLCVGGSTANVNVGLRDILLQVSYDGSYYTTVYSMQSSAGCPTPWVKDVPTGTCMAPFGPGCHSVSVPVNSVYTRVQGTVDGLQFGNTCAFGPNGRSKNIDDNYVDGLSITYSLPTQAARQHVWTYAAGVSDNAAFSGGNAGCGCPCTAYSAAIPPFAGSADVLSSSYYCDTGNHGLSPPGSVWLSGPSLWGTSGALPVSSGGYAQCVAMQGTYLCGSVTPSSTATTSLSATWTATPSFTPSSSASVTLTLSSTASATITAGITASASTSASYTPTLSVSASRTATDTPAPSASETQTPVMINGRTCDIACLNNLCTAAFDPAACLGACAPGYVASPLGGCTVAHAIAFTLSLTTPTDCSALGTPATLSALTSVWQSVLATALQVLPAQVALRSPQVTCGDGSPLARLRLLQQAPLTTLIVPGSVGGLTWTGEAQVERTLGSLSNATAVVVSGATITLHTVLVGGITSVCAPQCRTCNNATQTSCTSCAEQAVLSAGACVPPGGAVGGVSNPSSPTDITAAIIVPIAVVVLAVGLLAAAYIHRERRRRREEEAKHAGGGELGVANPLSTEGVAPVGTVAVQEGEPPILLDL